MNKIEVFNYRPSINRIDNNLWIAQSGLSDRDLRIKKIFFTILCLINLAGIVFSLVYVTMNYPIPSFQGATIILPMIAGVLSAMFLLKIPTYGVNATTCNNLANLPMTVSKVIALLMFGPSLLIHRAIDWTEYHTPAEARRIHAFIMTKDFVDVMEKYGPCVDNLEKYGFLNHQDAIDFRDLYTNSKADIERFKTWQKQNPGMPADEYDRRDTMTQHQRDWEQLKAQLNLPFPPLNLRPVTCGDRVSNCLNAWKAWDEAAAPTTT